MPKKCGDEFLLVNRLWFPLLLGMLTSNASAESVQKLDEGISLAVLSYDQEFQDMARSTLRRITEIAPDKAALPGVVSGLFFVALDDTAQDGKAVFQPKEGVLPPLFQVLTGTEFGENSCAITRIAESDGEEYFALLVDTAVVVGAASEPCVVRTFALYFGAPPTAQDINSFVDLQRFLLEQEP